MKNKKVSLDFSMVLASSVHDMKNSVGMLLNSLEEVIEQSPPENLNQANQFAILQYEASRINSELIQLLSLYNLKESRLSVHINEGFIIDAIDEQIARNDMLFKTRNITLSVDCDSDLMWYYDSDLLGNVIHNIIINAARYTKDVISLSVFIENGYLVITIADNGDGFPDSMLDNELSYEQPKENNSTQLGLFFASQVAQCHVQGDRAGYIELANGGDLGGSIFKVFLP